MRDLVVIEFDDAQTAFVMRAEQAKMQMEDVVTKNEEGKIKLHQAVNLTATGAVGGSFGGMLIGLIFPNSLLGAAMGAWAGALAGRLKEIGISDEFMKELAANLTEGTSALFILIRKSAPDKVLERLKGFMGKIRPTSLSVDREDELRKVIEGDSA